MACPITKTLTISFTPPLTTPSGGYRVLYRTVGATSYTTASGTYVSSPITLPNIPACEAIEGTIEAICGSTYSTPVTFTAAAGQTYTCASQISGGIFSASYYAYPKALINLTGSSDTITLTWTANSVPNRFTVYNSNNSVVTSTTVTHSATNGWVGESTAPGPWGLPLSTANTGTLTFSKATAGGDSKWYYLLVEHAGNASLQDAWDVSVSCSGSGSSGGTTYTVTPSVTSVNEGGSVTFNVTASGNLSGTLYYAIVASTGTVTGADFADNTLVGSFTMTNGTGSFSKTLVNDLSTEQAEGMYASIKSGSPTGTTLVNSAVVTINDTSQTQGITPTYTVTPSVTSVNEGSSVVFSVNTQNVVEASTLYYSIEGTVLAADFTDNSLTGSFIVNSQQGSITKTLTNDTNTDGSKTLIFKVRTGNATTGTIVATASTVTVNDTSQTGAPATPTYTLLALNQSSEQITAINEGDNLTIRLNTTNVTDNTTVAYVVTGIDSNDLSGNSDALTGNFTVVNNTADKNFFIAADASTDGTDTFVITLTGKGVSKTVTVNDTSTSPTWTGYSLTPVLDDADCTAVPDAQTVVAYKLNDPGAILSTDVLYSAQNVNSKLTSGFYSDGTYKYTVQAGGIVSNKTTCGSGVNPEATYVLTSNVESVNEGGTVTFTLTTSNVSLGELVAYAVTGIDSADLDSANNLSSLTGNFTAGEITTKTFVLSTDFTADGTETMTMTLTGKGVSKSVTVNDTSNAPAYKISVEVNAESTETVFCNSQEYNAYPIHLTATLLDGSNQPVNATSNITVTFKTTGSGCSGPYENTKTVVIPSGQSTANSTSWYLNTTNECGQYGCQTESEQYSCVVSNSAGYSWSIGTTICENI